MKKDKIEFSVVNDQGESHGLGTPKFISTFRAGIESVVLWLMIWSFTAPLVLVPIVHLVAVPAGLIGGIVLPAFMFRRRRGKLDINDGTALCPSCHASLSLVMDNISRSDHWGVCLNCKTGFTVPMIQIRIG